MALGHNCAVSCFITSPDLIICSVKLEGWTVDSSLGNFRTTGTFPYPVWSSQVTLKLIGTNWILSLFDLREKRSSLAWGDTDVGKNRNSKAGLQAFHPRLSATLGFLLCINSGFLFLRETPANVLPRRPQILGLTSLPHLCFLKDLEAAFTALSKAFSILSAPLLPLFVGLTLVGQHLEIRNGKGSKGHCPEKPLVAFHRLSQLKSPSTMVSRRPEPGWQGLLPPPTEPLHFCQVTCIHGGRAQGHLVWGTVTWAFAQGRCAQ